MRNNDIQQMYIDEIKDISTDVRLSRTRAVTPKKDIYDANQESKTLYEGNIKRPVLYKEFKKMTLAVQKMFINFLLTTYDITISDICVMFNCKHGTLWAYLNSRGIKSNRVLSGPRDIASYEKFYEIYVNPTTENAEEVLTETSDNCTDPDDVNPAQVIETPETKPVGSIEFINVQFKGSINEFCDLIKRTGINPDEIRNIKIEIS